MAYSYKEYVGDGSTDTFAIPFDYIASADISVFIDGVADTSFTFTTPSSVQTSSVPGAGAVIRVARSTDITSRAVDFASGSILTEEDLDNSNIQVFYAAQEAIDTSEEGLFKTTDGKFDAQSRVIKNVADPVDAQDAVTKNWAETAMSSQLSSATAQAAAAAASAAAASASATSAGTSASTATTGASTATTKATEASNSATAAATSASDAATSETNAATSASNASTSASNAATSANDASSSASAAASSATAAASSATAAASSATAAEATFDLFDDAYLGAKTADPSLDNDGNALQDGALYFDTANDVMKVYDLASTTWYQLTPTVANQTNINTVAGIASDVSSVAGIASDVSSVSGISANVTTVAGIDTETTTVAGISSDVSTVAGISANVTTVAGIDTEVTAVAGNASNINQVASDTAVINAASANATAAAASATSAASSATDAATSAAQANAVVQGTAAVRHSIRPSLLLDFANSKTLDPRIDFTRSSTATYYDGKTHAKAEENLLTYSEEFDNAVWQKAYASITANNTTAPDGTTTAELMTASVGLAEHKITQLISTSTNSFALSVYAKAGTSDYCGFRISITGSGWTQAVFDLANGTALNQGGYDSVAIQDVGNGWYRCSATFTGLDNNQVQIHIMNSYGTGSSDYNWTAAGTETIYVWGAQLEQRSSVTAYTPTTSQPITNYIPVLQTAAFGTARFDHDPVTGESKGLLIEEQRTNLFPKSQTPFGTNSVSSPRPVSNAGIAPDGTQTAMMYEYGTTGFEQRNVTISADTSSYALSIYVKPLTSDAVFNFSATGSYYGDYLSNPKFTFATESFSNDNGKGSFEKVGNGWYRLTFAPLTNDGDDVTFVVRIDALSSMVGKVLWWGIQLEQASFPTSYIPTSGSQVTRSADSASMTGDNFSSWYRQDEGTVYAEFNQFNTSSLTLPAHFDDGTNTNRHYLRPYSDGTVSVAMLVNSSDQFSGESSTHTVGSNNKAAYSYKVNDFALSSNGGAVDTDSSGLVPTGLTTLRFGVDSNSQYYSGFYMKKLAFYNKQLTDAEVTALTED